MSDFESKVFFAKNIQDIFQQKKSIRNLQIIGACTALKEMPEKSISVKQIHELKQISRHERHIDFGPAVTLSEILSLGERHVPKILIDALKTIATPFVRNLATIGGNILSSSQKMTLYAPLLALDSQLEIKSPSENSYISLQNFQEIPQNSILTNIRVPLNDWDVSIFERLGPSNKITEFSASYAFLANTEKRAITSIKIAFSGIISFKCNSLENKLLGLRLPLKEEEIDSYIQDASTIFDENANGITYKPILKKQFLNLVQQSLEQLK